MNLLSMHLTRLADFSGRENRQPFWLWVLIVYAVMTVLSMVVMIPVMSSSFAGMAPMMGHDQAYLDAHPELVQQMIAQTFGPMMQTFMIFGAVMAFVTIVLLAAAVARRLHDGDRSGWWAVPVFAVHVVTPLLYMSVFPRFASAMAAVRPDMTPDQVNAMMMPAMQSFMWLPLVGMAGFLLTIVLVIFLALPGTEGANRHGEDPLPPRRPARF